MTASGILNIDKEAGWTSFQVVAMVRKGSGVRKVGHAGTLDPSASGVLLVCLGQAVRVSEYLMELAKVYRARIALGVATDTYDTEGQPVATGDYSGVTEAHVREALARFVGSVQQLPPVYSAVKVGGQPAYRLARRGQPVVLKPRTARIDRIELLAFEPPLVELEVECGKGMYVRTLAHDLGQQLGCGAHLAGLVRTRVGPFSLDAAASLTALRQALLDGSWPDLLSPIDYGLLHLPALTLDCEDEKDVRHGCSVTLDAGSLPAGVAAEGGQRCRAYGEDGSLVAVLIYDEKTLMWRPEKVFTAL
ncbi:MAG TPA: tRNA pseudouridine(55) synthase TruB [Dehalococcoidia bacterium]|nr:tRNA pseudouridine(55) synthase TruB [Dehalococcoidia bacterium]